MKKKTIILLTSLLLLSAVFSGATGYALAKNEVIARIADHIKITNEGREINIGNDKPLLYNGRTYLPVRALSEALGYDIEWYGSSTTVNVSTPDSEYPIVALDGIEIIEASPSLNLMSNTAIQYVTVVVNQTKNFTHEPILILEVLKNGVVIDSQTLALEKTAGKYSKKIRSSQFSHQLGKLSADERLKKYNEQFSYRLKIK